MKTTVDQVQYHLHSTLTAEISDQTNYKKNPTLLRSLVRNLLTIRAQKSHLD